MAFAQASSGARYDLAHVATRARAERDGYVLDGEKRVVLHAPCAERLVRLGAHSAAPIPIATASACSWSTPKRRGVTHDAPIARSTGCAPPT